MRMESRQKRPLSRFRRGRADPGASGFTLVELVVVILLVGIIGGLGSMIIGNFVSGFTQGAERQALAGAGRIAVERMSRELRRAVPYSIVTFDAGAGADSAVLFVPASTGGRYRAVGGDDERLDFGNSNAGDTFQAFGLGELADTDQLFVYPLGRDYDADDDYDDIYNALGGAQSAVSRARVADPDAAGGAAGRDITLNANDFFGSQTRNSPGKRIFAASDLLAFCRIGNQLVLDRRPWTDFGGGGVEPVNDFCTGTDHPVLVSGVDDVQFEFVEGAANTRSALVQIYLNLDNPEADDEFIDFLHEVHVKNAS